MNDVYGKTYKIIFTGPVGAGKSTAINAISDIQTVSTEEFSTDETRKMKDLTTVAMDYGMLKIPGGEVVHLYGTPGQERFNYMWEILVEGGLGLVLLINNANPEPLQDLDFFIATFAEFIARTTLAVGVTNMDKSTGYRIEDYHRQLASHDLNYPVFEVDAREKKDVQILLQALLYGLVEE